MSYKHGFAGLNPKITNTVAPAGGQSLFFKFGINFQDDCFHLPNGIQQVFAEPVFSQEALAYGAEEAEHALKIRRTVRSLCIQNLINELLNFLRFFKRYHIIPDQDFFPDSDRF